jgi:phosphoserine phosphatase
MTLVATLSTDPARRALSPALAAYAAKAVSASGGVRWLSQDVACDIPLPVGIPSEEAAALLAAALASEPVDAAVQTAAGRRKRLLLADMDSTMIDQECIDELADEVGLKPLVAAITERSMRGEIAFEPALRERVGLLRGLNLNVIDRLLQNRITLAAGARRLIATMRRHGAWTVLVSGGFESFTGPIAARLGFDEHHANRLIAADGVLTGEVAEPILGREAKAQTLRVVAARLGLLPADAMAVGDGANDLDMIRLAGAGVAIHAKPAVAAAARFRIDHGDLTALLFLQGYSEAEFAA